MSRYWNNSVSLDHVQGAARGGFTQADHGCKTRLSRLQQGDWLVFYSAKTAYPEGKPLQKFSALGRILDEEPYQVEVSPDFKPWRRNMRFLTSQAAEIRPLLPELDFVPDKNRWGFPFRQASSRSPRPTSIALPRPWGPNSTDPVDASQTESYIVAR